MRGLFVTGTDTGVGKTVVTALVARELRAAGRRTGCYKPVCSGSESADDGSPRWSDIDTLASAIGNAFPKSRICPQTFHAPLAPPSAARLEGRQVDSALMRQGAEWWKDRVDILLVEGVGGLLCPVAESETVADVAADLDFPLLIVSPLILGSINHTLLTIEVALKRGLRIGGVVFNAAMGSGEDVAESSITEIAARTSVPLLGRVPFAPQGRPAQLIPICGTGTISWENVAEHSLAVSSCGDAPI